MRRMSDRIVIEDMKRLRDSGVTYQKIADKYGVSKQAVHQRLNSKSKSKIHYRSSPKLESEWPIVSSFLYQNDMTIGMLADRCGIKRSRLYSCLYGTTNFRKREADCISRIVGKEFLESSKFKTMR